MSPVFSKLSFSGTLSLTNLPFLHRTLDSLALYLDTANPEEIVRFRVPDTHTMLIVGVQDDLIQKPNLGRTILRTQQSLATYIKNYDAEDQPLVRTHNISLLHMPRSTYTYKYQEINVS